MFIVLDGIDGCGKSTQTRLLAERLQAAGREVATVRDPGGTALGERVRAILLDPQTRAVPVGELFGYLMSRAQLVAESIRPALERGAVVVSDRYYFATIAYQAFGLGLDRSGVEAAIDLCVAGCHPDLALWCDVPPPEAARRRAAGRGQEDRIEARGLAYLERVHAGFATLAAEGRMERVDGRPEPAVVAESIWRLVSRP